MADVISKPYYKSDNTWNLKGKKKKNIKNAQSGTHGNSTLSLETNKSCIKKLLVSPDQLEPNYDPILALRDVAIFGRKFDYLYNFYMTMTP